MMSKRVFTLDRPLFRKYLKRDGNVLCFHKNERLKIGDTVLSRSFGNRRDNVRQVLYCIACAEELNMA